MIDIKFLRENPDVVKENIKKKFQDKKLPLVDEVIELDEERRAQPITVNLRCLHFPPMISKMLPANLMWKRFLQHTV